MSFLLSIVILMGINLIAALGVYLLTGMTGLFSFGQAGFMAIGAYVSAVLSIKMGFSHYLAIAAGVLAAGIVAFLVGYPTIRLRTNYFAIATLGLSEAIRSVLNFFVGFTGGATGVGGIPQKVGAGSVVFCAVLCVLMVRSYVLSKFGRASVAVRTDELAAESLGINSFYIRIVNFILAACLAALAGGLLAFYMTYIAPDMFSVGRSVELIVIVFFGGLRSITGTVLSTVFLTGVPELLHFASEWRAVLLSLLVLAVIIFRPEGLMGNKEISMESIRSFFKRDAMRKGAKENAVS